MSSSTNVPAIKRISKTGGGKLTVPWTGIPSPAVPLWSQLNPEELDALMPVVKQLYIDLGQTSEEVRKVLRAQYNLSLSPRQFSGLRRKWGMQKNTRISDRTKILETLQTAGDSEETTIGNVTLTAEKLKRWKKNLNDKAVKDTATGSLPRVHRNTNKPPLQAIITQRQRQPTQHISSPETFRITEHLLFSIDEYVAGMYDQGPWMSFENSSSKNVHSATGDVAFGVLNKFYFGCITAFGLMQNRSFVAARKMLSSACGLLRSVITAHHPATLGFFLSAFNDLTARFKELEGVFNLLRDYIGRMAMIVLPESHPWRIVCCSFGKIDVKEFRQTVTLSMRTLADVFESKAGRFAKNTIQTRLFYLESAYTNDLENGEAVLQNLLSEARAADSVDHSDIIEIMKALAGNLTSQNRAEALEVLGTEYIAVAQNVPRAHGASARNLTTGFQITASAQHMLGKTDLAEANLRKSAEVLLATRADQDFTLAIRKLGRLESWLREWGRIADADKLKTEIDGLIERDTAGSENVF